MSELEQVEVEIRKRNALLRIANWVELGMTLVWSAVAFYAEGLWLARLVVLFSTGLYVLTLLASPRLLRWTDPGARMERQGAWLVGVGGYGGVFVLFLLWTLSDGAMP